MTTATAKPPAAFAPTRTLYVKQHDWPFRWLVESETNRAQPHMVDLSSYKGNGECSCLNFSCRLAPELKQGRHPSNSTRCKHIKAARGMFCDMMIRHHSTSNHHTGNTTNANES